MIISNFLVDLLVTYFGVLKLVVLFIFILHISRCFCKAFLTCFLKITLTDQPYGCKSQNNDLVNSKTRFKLNKLMDHANKCPKNTC